MIRLENVYKEKNFPFVEYPARYISKLIKVLQAAEKVYLKEVEDDRIKNGAPLEEEEI